MRVDSQNDYSFERKLVLQQWVLKLLEINEFKTLQNWLKDPDLEGFDPENISHFHHILVSHLFNRDRIPIDDLLRYDSNIVRHWQQITEKRNLLEGRTLTLKYFQYLALLFTEIYLERYFSNQEILLEEINETIDKYNAGKSARDQVDPFRREELNKIAFWMATGSGKTLLMHCNLLQYQHYLKQYALEKSVNRTILLTPNEGLSQQHLAEFERSNIPARLFSKQSLGGFFQENQIEIIDIHKLADEHGEKTVDVAAFEENNLVLVDEGHSGASGDTWMRRREALCVNGFSFEYSATFGQAVKGDQTLTQVYAKSILFDYSYRYFYYDGYGKEYRILNLKDDSHETQRYRYLGASLLAFYQQQKIHQQEAQLCQKYLLEKPLWVFVGGSVKAVYTRNKRRVSDVVDVLLFLAEFASADNQTSNTQLIQDFLDHKAGLLDDKGRDIFEDSFRYLLGTGLSAAEIYGDLLQILFNATSPGKLQIENLKGSDGEIGIKLGDNDYFGLINVGDANSLSRLCEDHPELVVTEQSVSESIFQQLDDPDSKINILIGSRKFMEGWNSWRVSTMGLMNIGRGEGTQIIQLFGRGVRLKGKDFSLKRSTELSLAHPPQHVPLLETLNIFGVRADYMQQFREHLRDEGLDDGEEKVEFIMPVIKGLGTKKLKVIKLQNGADFKKQAPGPVLQNPEDGLNLKRVEMNWYPRIQALSSIQMDDEEAILNTGYFTQQHLAFLDFDELYYELEQFKDERNWHNLVINREVLKPLLLDNTWYTLTIPPEELEFHNFQNVRRWQEIATGLLKKYCDQYYKNRKKQWESNHLEYQELTEDDPNFFEEYRILIEKSREDLVAKLEEIKQAIEAEDFKDIAFSPRFSAVMFERHLYQPLLYLGGGINIEVKPVALNDSERNFIEDLQVYYQATPDFFNGKELYLLRNRSRGKGIGFFEAGNFYPDFIMWLVNGDKQHVTFIDPHGMGREGYESDKVNFFETIKDIERDLGDPDVILNSFIISPTRFGEIPTQATREEWGTKNVLFQVEEKDSYIGSIFERIGVEL
ncbi:DEAD/DEAH box helicase family protein [bacterium]|nr:DEAD/DEAH box helicase family protein [bacterium]